MLKVAGQWVHAVTPAALRAAMGAAGEQIELLAVGGAVLDAADPAGGEGPESDSGSSDEAPAPAPAPTPVDRRGLAPDTAAFLARHPELPWRAATLMKRADEPGLGLRLFSPHPTWQRPNPRGTSVAMLAPGLAAERCGALGVGDVLVQVNGACVATASHERVVAQLRAAGGGRGRCLVGHRVRIVGLREDCGANGTAGTCVEVLDSLRGRRYAANARRRRGCWSPRATASRSRMPAASWRCRWWWRRGSRLTAR